MFFSMSIFSRNVILLEFLKLPELQNLSDMNIASLVLALICETKYVENISSWLFGVAVS